jgi:hypothetical protein
MRRNRSAMILVTQSELLELVEELRGMAVAAPTAKVREVLTRMADRYAARADARLTKGYATLRGTRATPVPRALGKWVAPHLHPHDVIGHELRDRRES